MIDKETYSIIEYAQKQVMEACQTYMVPLDGTERHFVKIPIAVRVKVWQEGDGLLHFKIGELIYKEKEM